MSAAPVDDVPEDRPAADAPLTGAYRLLRRVAPPEATFAGRLAHRRDGETVLLVDADQLEGWQGLTAADGGHVLAATDLVRCATGTCIELPWCTERLDRLLDRREVAEALLAPGETVTLAVSVRRGLAEIAASRPRRDSGWPTGEWWVTDAGRPLFVHATDALPADAAARAALIRIAALTADARVQTIVARMASVQDHALLHTGVDDELFASAEPAAVVTTAFAPLRARSLDTAARLGLEVSAEAERRRLGAVLERHLDADLAGMASDAVHGLLRRLRGRARPRPWMVAVGVVALVVGGGLLWPTGESTPAQAGDVPAVAESGASPAPEVDATEGADEVATPNDAARILGTLLDARSACAGDTACLASVAEDPSLDLPHGPIDLPAAQRTITLLDEFGGAAVLRVDGDDSTTAAQLVVIVESDGRWLLRDVHDVAQQG